MTLAGLQIDDGKTFESFVNTVATAHRPPPEVFRVPSGERGRAVAVLSVLDVRVVAWHQNVPCCDSGRVLVGDWNGDKSEDASIDWLTFASFHGKNDAMSFLGYLGRWSAFVPESRLKSWARLCAYAFLSRMRVGSRTQDFRGVPLRLGYYPFMGGTGFDLVALNGYLRHRDVQTGDVVVDAGPYVGDFTVYASIRAGPTGKVIAFEPDRASCRMLVSNIRLNRLRNVQIVRKALWNADTTMFLTSTAFASELSQDSSRYVSEVVTASLDNELQRMGVTRVDFVKMDIEGAETEALCGMSRTLITHPYVAVASYHRTKPDNTPTVDCVEDILRTAGYNVLTEYPEHLTTFGVFGRPI